MLYITSFQRSNSLLNKHLTKNGICLYIYPRLGMTFYTAFFLSCSEPVIFKNRHNDMGQGISLYLKIEAKNKHAIKPPTYLLMFTNNPSSVCLRGPLSTLTNVDTRSFLPMSRNACFKNHKSISSGPHLMIAFLSRRSKKSRMFSFSFRLFLLTRSFARKVRIRKSSQFILSQTSSNSWRQLHIVPSISIFNVYKTCAPKAISMDCAIHKIHIAEVKRQQEK